MSGIGLLRQQTRSLGLVDLSDLSPFGVHLGRRPARVRQSIGETLVNAPKDKRAKASPFGHPEALPSPPAWRGFLLR